MARNGSGVYSLPGGYLATTGATATASQHNTPLEDLETDMNTARPIVAGGTGGTSAATARTNLAVGEAHGNGSAAAPAVSFSADADTGLFRADADELGFATSGAEIARLTAAALLVGKTAREGTNTVLEVSGGDSGVTPNGSVRAFFENNGSCAIEIGSNTTGTSSIRMSDSNAEDFAILCDHNSAGKTTIEANGDVVVKPDGTSSELFTFSDTGFGFNAFQANDYDVSSASGFGVQMNITTGQFTVQTDSGQAAGYDVFRVYAGTSQVAAIEANGDFLSATNSYGALSDVRLKDRVQDAPSVWNDFQRVQFRSFDWKHSGLPDVGVIAQEIKPVFPELVSPREDGFQSVNYAGLALRASMALQEAMKRIEDLERRLAAMQE